MGIYNYTDKNGKTQDPFAIGTSYRLPPPASEALKKILAAGVNGRKKSKKEDVQDAIDTLNRCKKDRDLFLPFCQISVDESALTSDEIAAIYGLHGSQLIALKAFINWVLSEYQDDKAWNSCVVNLELLRNVCK